MDTIDKETRSRIMSSIKGKDTKPERTLRSAVWRRGLRFRKNDPRLPGKPDLVFASAKVAVFVDGDFWHGRTWLKEGKLPKTNTEFWEAKFRKNVERDLRVDRELARLGWLPVRIWESSIMSDPASAADLVEFIVKRLSHSKPSF